VEPRKGVQKRTQVFPGGTAALSAFTNSAPMRKFQHSFVQGPLGLGKQWDKRRRNVLSSHSELLNYLTCEGKMAGKIIEGVYFGIVRSV